MTDVQQLTRDFLRDDAGSPLGSGMPSGAPLRMDGQSHYEAWQALLRRDPCAYCGAARGGPGTVDHVDPRSRSARGVGTVHGWINTVGACARCNGAKRDLGLLVFLYRRRWSAPGAYRGEPAHARCAQTRAGGPLRPPPTYRWGGSAVAPLERAALRLRATSGAVVRALGSACWASTRW